MEFLDLKAQHARIAADIDGRISRVLAHQRFIQGPEVTELEGKLSEFCGAKHTISCANGTDALLVALMALNVGPGCAVFVPSFTYTATAEVVLLLGAQPVFVDVDPVTYNVDFDSAETAVERTVWEGSLRPAVLLTVDLFGMPVDYDRARQLADRYNMAFVSDAAQSFGASYKGKRVGSDLADITTTSFFPAKPLGCYGDGGAIFTGDLILAERMRSICLHGKGQEKYDVVRVGVNSRLDTLQAAVLLPKLDIFPDELQRRNSVAREYAERLEGHVGTPLLPKDDDQFAWAQFTVQLDDRAGAQARAKAAGVPTAIYYPLPMHLQPAYLAYGQGKGSLPVSEALSKSVLSLPMHPYLTSKEIHNVCDVLLSPVEV